MLTASLANHLLGAPTKIDGSGNSDDGNASGCQRDLVGDASTYIILVRTSGPALHKFVVHAGMKSLTAYMADARRTQEKACHAGMGLLSLPKELAPDAVLCILNGGTTGERSELYWTHGEALYELFINLDQDDDAPPLANRALTLVRQMNLVPGG